ncbi:MAG TPA: hypothetical protein VLZ05_01500 [Mycobacterium sp.]|nr:hypothetical protein [Mycobacterium sp.]HUH67652.1 hypothetical protein [Mycobacterium sp.]
MPLKLADPVKTTGWSLSASMTTNLWCTRTTADLYPLGLIGYMRHLQTLQQFFADADAGMLPPFCIVDPDFDDFSEENPKTSARARALQARSSRA